MGKRNSKKGRSGDLLEKTQVIVPSKIHKRKEWQWHKARNKGKNRVGEALGKGEPVDAVSPPGDSSDRTTHGGLDVFRGMCRWGTCLLWLRWCWSSGWHLAGGSRGCSWGP